MIALTTGEYMNSLMFALLLFSLTPEEDAAMKEFEQQQKQVKPVVVNEPDTINYQSTDRQCPKCKIVGQLSFLKKHSCEEK